MPGDKLKQALKPSLLTARTSLLFLQVTSQPSHPFILLPRENVPHPLCHGKQSSTGRLRRFGHQDILHLLAKGTRGMDSLRNIEVKTNNLASSQSLFSQPRMDHGAVSINERIFILGGVFSTKTGEIVGDGKTQIGI